MRQLAAELTKERPCDSTWAKSKPSMTHHRERGWCLKVASGAFVHDLGFLNEWAVKLCLGCADDVSGINLLERLVGWSTVAVTTATVRVTVVSATAM